MTAPPALLKPHNSSPPLRGRCRRKPTEGGVDTVPRVHCLAIDYLPPSVPYRGHLPLKGGKGNTPHRLGLSLRPKGATQFLTYEVPV